MGQATAPLEISRGTTCGSRLRPFTSSFFPSSHLYCPALYALPNAHLTTCFMNFPNICYFFDPLYFPKCHASLSETEESVFAWFSSTCNTCMLFIVIFLMMECASQTDVIPFVIIKLMILLELSHRLPSIYLLIR